MNAKLEHNLRLYSGLIIAIFLVLHLLTAALGLLSLSVMDEVGGRLMQFWSMPVFFALLYGAFAVHIVMAFTTILTRRTWRMPVWNLLQIAFGLGLPVLLISHAMGTRGADILLDVQRSYSDVVTNLWNNPSGTIRQYILIFLAWAHTCIGLHFWLRHKSGYAQWWIVLYPLGLLIPVVAALGFARAGIDTKQLQPEVVAEFTAAMRNADPLARAALRLWSDRLLDVYLALLGLLLFISIARDIRLKRRGNFSIRHTTSNRLLRGSSGQSLLDVLRISGIPHASVCGGRGRCTTCRVRVQCKTGELTEPEALEQAALKRIDAGPNIRLACQFKPEGEVTVTPILQPDINASAASQAGNVIGHEQFVACMFADMRDSTKLSEKKLPYDVVFILNHFFIQLADSLKNTNGHYANFTGDGIMGLYGLHTDSKTGCRDALQGAIEIQRRIDLLNKWLAPELGEPLRVGIGIHCGEAIVGTIGPPDLPITTALGDNINIAARLESLTKKHNTKLVVSEAVLKQAAVDYSGLAIHTAAVHGSGSTVGVVVVDNPETLLKSMPSRVHSS